MNISKVRKPLGHSLWFKVLLTILLFMPAFSELPYDPAKTSDVIGEVLTYPLAATIPVLLPLAKLLLLMVAILPFLFPKGTAKVLLGYYAFILLVVGVLQNMAHTNSFGFVWLTGNTLVQLILAAYCLYDLLKDKSSISGPPVKARLWVLLPMALAFLMPYSMDSGLIQPSLGFGVFLNEAGVTYCMITPVILGIMIIFAEGIYKPLLSAASFIGFLFGLLNMTTWFAMQSQNWWMGVLHLPLVILSLYGLLLGRAGAMHSLNT